MAVVVGVWQMAAGRVIISTEVSPPQTLPETELKRDNKAKCPQKDRNKVRAHYILGHNLNH